MTKEFPLKSESYEIIGLCMEVQNTLGYGFSEVVYKDALEFELEDNCILYSREAELNITYKGKQLKHRFFADFITHGKLIIEVKSCEKGITDDHLAQTLNYLRVLRKRVDNFFIPVSRRRQPIDNTKMIVPKSRSRFLPVSSRS